MSETTEALWKAAISDLNSWGFQAERYRRALARGDLDELMEAESLMDVHKENCRRNYIDYRAELKNSPD